MGGLVEGEVEVTCMKPVRMLLEGVRNLTWTHLEKPQTPKLQCGLDDDITN